MASARLDSDTALVLMVVHVYREEIDGEQIIRITSARGADKNDVRGYRKQAMDYAERRSAKHHAAEQAKGDDSDIDDDDIPRLTDKQLAQMVRMRDIRPKIPVSVRLDPSVLGWLQSKGEGHPTRINEILRNIVEAEKRIAQR